MSKHTFAVRKGSASRIARLPTDRLMAELSLWSADLLALREAILATEQFADLYHLDVADGHFAPALLIFPDLVARIREATDIALHVHLMATNDILFEQVRQFVDAGADVISIHAENGEAVGPALEMISEAGVAGGLVLQLDTPLDAITPFLGRISMVTLLGTGIGVKGQPLDPRACPRLAAARDLIAGGSCSRRVILAADGGIRQDTVRDLHAAGAETIVMGSLAFQADDLPARIGWIRGLAAAKAMDARAGRS